MNSHHRNNLRAVPGSLRDVALIGYEVRPEADYSAAHTEYLARLSKAKDAQAAPVAPRSVRPIVRDSSGACFSVHDSEDGPVTLPVQKPPALRHEAAGAGGFISPDDVQSMRSALAASSESDRALYAAAAQASARNPGLVAKATGDLLKSAMQQGLKELASGLAGGGDPMGAIKGFMPTGGGALGPASLTAGAGMLSGQIAGMAFGALNNALFGGIGDDSSMGAQLGAMGGQKAMGEIQGAAADQLASAIQGAIDPASVPPPAPGNAQGAGEKIKEFFGGVSSSACMPAARVGDATAHGGKIMAGAGNTLFNGMAAARALDPQVCPLVDPGPVPHVGGPIREGNPTILIESMGAARVGHLVICTGVGQQNPIAAGSGDILLGEQTAAALPPPEPIQPPSSKGGGGGGGGGAQGAAKGGGSGKGSGGDAGGSGGDAEATADSENKSGTVDGKSDGNGSEGESIDDESRVKASQEECDTMTPDERARRDELREKLNDPNLPESQRDELLQEYSDIDRANGDRACPPQTPKEPAKSPFEEKIEHLEKQGFECKPTLGKSGLSSECEKTVDKEITSLPFGMQYRSETKAQVNVSSGTPIEKPGVKLSVTQTNAIESKPDRDGYQAGGFGLGARVAGGSSGVGAGYVVEVYGDGRDRQADKVTSFKASVGIGGGSEKPGFDGNVTLDKDGKVDGGSGSFPLRTPRGTVEVRGEVSQKKPPSK